MCHEVCWEEEGRTLKLHSSSDRHGHSFAVLHWVQTCSIVFKGMILRNCIAFEYPYCASRRTYVRFLVVGRAATLKACDENNLLSFESLKEISEIDEMLLSEELVCPRSLSEAATVTIGEFRKGCSFHLPPLFSPFALPHPVKPLLTPRPLLLLPVLMILLPSLRPLRAVDSGCLATMPRIYNHNHYYIQLPLPPPLPPPLTPRLPPALPPRLPPALPCSYSYPCYYSYSCYYFYFNYSYTFLLPWFRSGILPRSKVFERHGAFFGCAVFRHLYNRSAHDITCEGSRRRRAAWHVGGLAKEEGL